MSKAVLVMDMPERCVACKFLEGRYTCYCNEAKRDIDVNFYYGKPDWCPLKPLPEKKDVKNAKTMTDLGWIEGFNACLDAIGGGE